MGEGAALLLADFGDDLSGGGRGATCLGEGAALLQADFGDDLSGAAVLFMYTRRVVLPDQRSW